MPQRLGHTPIEGHPEALTVPRTHERETSSDSVNDHGEGVLFITCLARARHSGTSRSSSCMLTLWSASFQFTDAVLRAEPEPDQERTGRARSSTRKCGIGSASAGAGSDTRLPSRLRDRLVHLARALGVLDLVDGVLQLAVKDAPVGDHDDTVEDSLV